MQEDNTPQPAPTQPPIPPEPPVTPQAQQPVPAPPQPQAVVVPAPAAPDRAIPPDTSAPLSPAQNFIEGKSNQQTYEYIMLAFGLVTIASFFLRNGFLLKIGVGFFLLVATISIINGLSRPSRTGPRDPDTLTFTPKTKKVIKVLGIGIIALLALPVMGFMAMIAFFVLMITIGGQDMGT